jgi:hypothetical protein
MYIKEPGRQALMAGRLQILFLVCSCSARQTAHMQTLGDGKAPVLADGVAGIRE